MAENYTLTSGREVTVDYDEDNGEPLTISWMGSNGELVIVSENEVFEMQAIIEGDADVDD